MTATYHAQRSNPCWVSNAHELRAVDMKASRNDGSSSLCLVSKVMVLSLGFPCLLNPFMRDALQKVAVEMSDGSFL